MKYISLFSGIEAASVAFTPLGWKPVLFAEVDPFCCALLAHHYPNVLNVGDINAVDWQQYRGHADLVVAGPPCQAFSVAGLRHSLEDSRGNLTLDYVRALNAIDPLWSITENVPGLLSTRDNAFGALLAGLVGADTPLLPAHGQRWTDAGVATGPQRTVAWRCLDAQYYGVPQRRRRVFLLSIRGTRNWRAPAALFSFADCLPGDSPPRREAGESVTDYLSARTSAGGEFGTDFDVSGGLKIAYACNAKGGLGRLDAESETFVTYSTNGQGYWREGNSLRAREQESHEQLMVSFADQRGRTNGDTSLVEQAHTLHAMKGQSESQVIAFTERTRQDGRNLEIQNDLAYCLTSPGNGGRPDSRMILVPNDIAPCLTQNYGKQPDSNTSTDPMVVVETTNTLYNTSIIQGDVYGTKAERDTIALLRSMWPAIGEEAFCRWSFGILASFLPQEILQQALHGQSLRCPAISRNWLVYCALSCPQDLPTRAMQSVWEAQGQGCSSQRWQPSEQCARELGAYLSELSQPGASAEKVMRCLWESTERVGVLRQALSTLQEIRQSLATQGQSVRINQKRERAQSTEDMSGTNLQPAVSCEGVLQQTCSADTKERQDYQVRRLTALECEFLQGFPRSYTLIPYRGKPAKDSPRYRSIGNSFAVPVVRWIAERIQALTQRERHGCDAEDELCKS